MAVAAPGPGPALLTRIQVKVTMPGSPVRGPSLGLLAWSLCPPPAAGTVRRTGRGGQSDPGGRRRRRAVALRLARSSPDPARGFQRRIAASQVQLRVKLTFRSSSWSRTQTRSPGPGRARGGRGCCPRGPGRDCLDDSDCQRAALDPGLPGIRLRDSGFKCQLSLSSPSHADSESRNLTREGFAPLASLPVTWTPGVQTGLSAPSG
jgi:hypothetical protein